MFHSGQLIENSHLDNMHVACLQTYGKCIFFFTKHHWKPSLQGIYGYGIGGGRYRKGRDTIDIYIYIYTVIYARVEVVEQRCAQRNLVTSQYIDTCA